MKSFKFSHKTIVSFVTVSTVIFAFLSFSKFNPYQTLSLLGSAYLLFVPGFLVLRLLKLNNYDFWIKFALTIALSVFSLMLVGFLGNEILLLSKFEHPLSIKPIIIELLVLIFGLIYINQSKEVSLEVEINNYLSEYSTKDLFFVFSPFVFIVMTIIGAVRLNNGGDGIVTLFMLIFMGIYIIFLTYNSSKLGKHVIETSIFLLSISLLLMTSLRGWYVTGHDIQREYRVFQIANINEVWKISLFQDAYNACMSITILPTIFSKLLGIFDPYIYKIIFQFIFATVPVIVYKFARRNVSILVSLLSAFYFMFFPTFFSDMPFLNRQEIAFLFLSLMYYILFDEGMDIKKRRWIFSFLGVIRTGGRGRGAARSGASGRGHGRRPGDLSRRRADGPRRRRFGDDGRKPPMGSRGVLRAGRSGFCGGRPGAEIPRGAGRLGGTLVAALPVLEDFSRRRVFLLRARRLEGSDEEPGGERVPADEERSDPGGVRAGGRLRRNAGHFALRALSAASKNAPISFS
jgi:hypothetical protein